MFSADITGVQHVGYVSEDKEWIYIGHGEWIPYKSYCNIKFGVKRPSQFVKKMAIAVYGVDTLIKSTISGRGSNRSKQQFQPQEVLDPIKLLAIKDIYRYYLTTVLGKNPAQVEVHVDKTCHYISHKIADMKRNFLKKNLFLNSRKETPAVGGNSCDPGGSATVFLPNIEPNNPMLIDQFKNEVLDVGPERDDAEQAV